MEWHTLSLWKSALQLIGGNMNPSPLKLKRNRYPCWSIHFYEGESLQSAPCSVMWRLLLQVKPVSLFLSKVSGGSRVNSSPRLLPANGSAPIYNTLQRRVSRPTLSLQLYPAPSSRSHFQPFSLIHSLWPFGWQRARENKKQKTIEAKMTCSLQAKGVSKHSLCVC